jgi:hypothetical protein
VFDRSKAPTPVIGRVSVRSIIFAP